MSKYYPPYTHFWLSNISFSCVFLLVNEVLKCKEPNVLQDQFPVFLKYSAVLIPPFLHPWSPERGNMLLCECLCV